MNIVILDQNTLTIGDVNFEKIEKLGNVSKYDAFPHTKPELITEACKDAEIVLINKAKFTREVIEKLPKLRYIGLFATGYNNVDIKTAREHGIDVVNAPGYSSDSVAQLVFAFIMSFATSIADYNASVHRGEWVYSKTFAYFPYRLTELSGKTLGIVGYGAIAKRVAKIGDAFGMNVEIYSRRRYDDCPYKQVDKETLFKNADFLSLNCPLNEGTANIINEGTIKLMKPTAFIVNTARGGCVDSCALANALNEGRIAGAGIDVLVNEPMEEDDPLRTAKNCIITPHIAWASIEARRRLLDMVAGSIETWMAGSPRYVVN